MASTYVNDLRLNEMATGDQSGSWGTVTNTNLELIGEALGYGTQQVFGSDANATTEIADGASDPARAMYFKVTSAGNLTATRTMTVDPDTVSRLMFIENATSGSQSIAVKQGSGAGAAVTIPTGQTKAVILPGSGSGSIVLDAFAALSVVDLLVDDDLTVTDDVSIGGTALVTGVLTTTAATVSNGGGQFNGAINVGIDDTGYDVKFFGDTASAYMLWDASADDLILGGTAGLSVNGTAFVTGGATINGSAVFNQDAADVDFRVEGDEAFAFFVHGADSSVQMGGASQQTVGTMAPGRLLLLNDNNSNPELKLFRQDTSIGNGANLGEIIAYSNDTADNDIMPVAKITFAADGTFSATNNPSTLLFFTTPASSETIRQVGGFNQAGSFVLSSTGGTIVTQTEGTSNFRAGVNAGNSIVSGGNYNVCVGDEAGTTLSTGDESVFVGYAAGDAISTGTQNVAIGSNALGTGITATNNTAVGRSSMAATLGAENTAVGVNTLAANQGGSHSVAIGSAALTAQNPSSGSVDFYNTAVGSKAGESVTIGTKNTLIGGQAADALTEGTFNCVLGAEALTVDTKGNASVAIGRAALETQNFTSATTTQNVAVGNQAGLRNATGTECTFIGAYSGRFASTSIGTTFVGTEAGYGNDSARLSGDDNTAIGRDAGHDLQGAATNNTMLGSFAGQAVTTHARNTMVGVSAGNATNTSDNTFLGCSAGADITTGDANTIVGRYNGDQGGLDIRASSNNIVLSDGDGNPRLYYTNNSWSAISGVADWGYIMTNYVANGDGLVIGVNENASTRNFIGMYSGDAGRYNAFIRSDGDFESYNNSYGGISDAKLKENIVDAPSQWDDLKSVRVRKYSLISDKLDQGNQLGVVAQELELSGMSGLVKDAPDRDVDGKDLGTTTKSVKYSILYMKAVKALQEAMTRIETLETKVAALEG